MRKLSLTLVLLFGAAGVVSAQEAGVGLKPTLGVYNAMTPLVFVGDGSHPSVRLPASPAVGLELDWRAGGFGVYASFIGAFSQLEHTSLLELHPANGPRSQANIYAMTGGFLLGMGAAAVQPFVRVGGGAKLYDFSWIEYDADDALSWTGDVGFGFNSRQGSLSFFAEARWMLSFFDAEYLPIRLGGESEGQIQHDMVFQMGFRFGPAPAARE